MKLHDHGVFLVNGVPRTTAPAGVTEAEAKKGTIAYGILKAHNTSDSMQDLRMKFDSMTSHDITYVGIIQTARASGMKEFPLPYVMTNCHNSLCAVGGTINEDDHRFGLSAAKKYGGIFVPPHMAVIHQYMRERFAGCGKMILGSDSHTRYGALGTMAIGEGGDFDYYKLTFENRLYYKVGRKHVIALRFMGGYANGDMPYYDLFTLGGADNLRGYEDDEFRGNKMYAATVEYRYPIAKKIQGVFFVDAGSAWDGTENIPWYQNDDSIHVSTGLGFRITTPIGPIRLDYGVGDDGGKFHFSFGGKF